MDNTKLNVSSENLINIINCINDIKQEINNIIDKIDMINVNGTWSCNSSEQIKKVFINKLSIYIKECDDMSLLMKKLIDNLENYIQVDKQLINLISG